MRVDGELIEILLTGPVTAESGPFAGAEGRIWVLPESASTAELMPIAATRDCLAPALVTVGHLEGQQVLVDLEATGSLLIAGDPALTGPVIRTLATELATTACADDLRVVVVGDLPAGIVALERIEVVADIAAGRDLVDAAADRIAEELGRLGLCTTWAGRLRNVGDGWTPTVVVAGPGLSSEDVTELIDFAAGRPGVALAVAVESDQPVPVGATHLALEGGTARLEPLGLDLAAPGMPDELLARTADLLRVALSDEPGEQLPVDLVDEDAIRDGQVTENGSAGANGAPSNDVIEKPLPTVLEDDPDRVLIRILGPVEIEGGDTPIDRRRVKELVVYLALHPRGATEAQIKNALWDEEPSRAAFNQTVFPARTALGAASDGTYHVPYVADCLYRPGPHLVTDWDILEAARQRVRQVPSDTVTRERLRTCLADVRGLPFEGTKGFEWAYEEGPPSSHPGDLGRVVSSGCDRRRHLERRGSSLPEFPPDRVRPRCRHSKPGKWRMAVPVAVAASRGGMWCGRGRPSTDIGQHFVTPLTASSLPLTFGFLSPRPCRRHRDRTGLRAGGWNRLGTRLDETPILRFSGAHCVGTCTVWQTEER